MNVAEAIACAGLAHMVGDYVIQSDWMASEKTKLWWPARWQDKVYAKVSGSSHVA